jgi:hypothetical protein
VSVDIAGIVNVELYLYTTSLIVSVYAIVTPGVEAELNPGLPSLFDYKSSPFIKLGTASAPLPLGYWDGENYQTVPEQFSIPLVWPQANCFWKNKIRVKEVCVAAEVVSLCGAANPAYEVVFYKVMNFTYETLTCTNIVADLLANDCQIYALLKHNGIFVSLNDNLDYALQMSYTTTPVGAPDNALGLSHWAWGSIFINEVEVAIYHKLTMDQDLTGYVAMCCIGTAAYPGSKELTLNFI